jgi:hypothetical protein
MIENYINLNDIFFDNSLFGINLAANLIPSVSKIRVDGRNPAIQTGVIPADIWNGGGVYTGFTNTIGKIDVYSSLSTDSPSGQGAKKVLLYGLDANYEPITEVITLNGTTKVRSTNNFIRCYRAKIIEAGTDKANNGVITAERAGNVAIVFFKMPAGDSQTQLSAFTVPKGWTAFLLSWYAYTNRGAGNQFDREADICFTIIENETGVRYRGNRVNITNNSPYSVDYWMKSFPIAEKNDIIVTCTGVSQNDTDITSGYQLLLVENKCLTL